MDIAIKPDESKPVTKPSQQRTICGISCIHKSSLEEPILVKHVDDKAFQCTKCLETNQVVKFFAAQHHLNKHIKRVHGPTSFKCTVCFKAFKDSTNFARHKRSHSQANLRIHKCDLCTNAFRYNQTLQSHLFYAHKQKREGVRYFKCEICSREFVVRSALERHVIHQHVVDKAFECPVCSRKFIDQETLKKHMKRHDKQKDYFCDVCLQGFIQKRALAKHLGVMHNHFFYCDKKCLRSFKNKPDFDAHISHSKQELKCYVCQKTMSSECNLKIHTDSHVKEIKTETKDNKIKNQIKPLETDTKFTPKSTETLNSENLTCELCFKIFDREAYLRAHRNKVHQHAEWKCNFEECSKTFKMFCQLRLHKMTHTDTKELTCNICHKSFYRPFNLKRHEQVHLKEKKYRCEICPKSFAEHFELRSHIANSHGGIKPFKCPVVKCGKFWANNSQLNLHLISHQTDKPFICEQCTKFKAFKTLGYLKIHQRRVHLETKKNIVRASQRKKIPKTGVFICSACSFKTVNEKDVVFHYNKQHGLPKVVLLRNNCAPPQCQ